MRVLFNGASAIKPKSGVGHTTANLHRALCEHFPDDSFWLYPGERLTRLARRMVAKPQRPAVKGPGTIVPGRSMVGEWAKNLAKAANRAALRTVARWGNFDLYHEPNFVPVRTHLPTVVTVHDLSVILHPEWHPADRVKLHEREFARGLESARHVVVVSHAVRRELIAHMGLTPERVTAVHWGIGGEFRPHTPAEIASVRERLELPPRFLLYVGTIEPRKNVRALLKAFRDLPAAVREACPLVLAGGWGWKSEPERELLAETRPLGVRHLGYVLDADLPALYAAADALLYPSYYEGFGLPPVEMLACGGAAIVSTADAVREVVGGHAAVFHPDDLEGWRDAMHRAATEPDWLAALRRGGTTHAARFTWENTARATFDVYQRVLRIAPRSGLRRAA
jgi:glycosyltransferase involved in cell wall biosynthesis